VKEDALLLCIASERKRVLVHFNRLFMKVDYIIVY
jgi:hypothetical protein